MTWVGLPIDILERLERLGVSRDDRLLYVEGFVYAGQYMTDGVVTSRLPRLSDHPDPAAAAAHLVEIEVWEHHDDSYFISDYLSANLTSEEITRRKADLRIRQERSRRHKAGDHSKCIRGRYCPDGVIDHVTRDRTRDNTRESQNTYLPDLPEPKAKVGKDKSVDHGRGSPDGSPTAASTSGEVLHVFTDVQRIGRCTHCNESAKNGAHHNGVPSILKTLAETVVSIGPLVTKRSSDDVEHWWEAVIRASRAKWTFETCPNPINDDRFNA
ncbi:MAG: hypothetical protein WAO40_04935, partial [Candidatus Nanopelagicales bacterium]